jgi:hypothetical protein
MRLVATLLKTWGVAGQTKRDPATTCGALSRRYSARASFSVDCTLVSESCGTSYSVLLWGGLWLGTKHPRP